MTTEVRILIVDDYQDMADSITQAINIEYPKIEVHYAKDGVEGYAKTCKYSYDLIITDYRMPILDGIRFAGYVRNGFDSLNPKTPFILMSSYVPELSEQSEIDFAAAIFPKPLDLVKLMKKIKLLVGKKMLHAMADWRSA